MFPASISITFAASEAVIGARVGDPVITEPERAPGRTRLRLAVALRATAERLAPQPHAVPRPVR
jgi:hypothetical protein